jgi:hypothetical protein
MSTKRSISKAGSSNAFGNGCFMVFLAIFGLAFGGMGFLVTYTASIKPLLNLASARNWQPAQCEVLFSQVQSSSSGRNSTSRINIQYRYTWNDRLYNGTHYDFNTGSDNFNNEAKEAVVAAHRPGSTVPCFVNPADPTQSVINRDFRWAYLTGLGFGIPFASVPLLFVALGIYSRRRMMRKQAAGIAANVPLQGTSGMGGSATPIMGVGSGPVVLKPEASRGARLFGMILLCAFWNGIVGVFTYFEVTGKMHDVGWWISLFLIPFQLIGLALVWGVIRTFLTLFAPKPTLTLSADSVPVGGQLTLQWQMSGAVGRLRSLKIALNAREEATYRRGTTTTTDKHTFYDVSIVEATDTSRIERGMTTVTIPRNAMHSFRADDNKIIWSLRVTGDIGFFPDVDETFDIQVRPA